MITNFVWSSEDIEKLVRRDPQIYALAKVEGTMNNPEIRWRVRGAQAKAIPIARQRGAQGVYQMCKGPRLLSEVLNAGKRLYGQK